jgi:hypothetical protein
MKYEVPVLIGINELSACFTPRKAEVMLHFPSSSQVPEQVRASQDVASSAPTKPSFKPFVSTTETRPELTARALILGSLFGVLFGAVTVYVGLRAGLTVGASIPISVLSISILRAFGRSSILENNIVQSTGNAGSSIAAESSSPCPRSSSWALISRLPASLPLHSSEAGSVYSL